MYDLQPKAYHQRIKVPFKEFRWIGPHVIEKALPKNNYLVQKLRTNKTQVLHRKRLRLFTPRQPIPDIQPTSQKWKPDPEVIIKHDDLCARAWESEYETLVFDNGQREPDSGYSPEITVRYGLQDDGTCTIPGTIREDSPDFPPRR